jgi:hypothetical protein
LCIFLLVAGGGDLHKRCKKTKKKKMFPIHSFVAFIGGGAWSNAPLLFLQF